jgi:hypothetical protein
VIPSTLTPALQSSSGRRLPVETCRAGEDDTGAVAPRLPQMTRIVRSARQGGWCRQRHRVAHQSGDGSLSGAPQTPSATAPCQCQSTPDADRTSLFKDPIASPAHRLQQFRQFCGIKKLIINSGVFAPKPGWHGDAAQQQIARLGGACLPPHQAWPRALDPGDGRSSGPPGASPPAS